MQMVVPASPISCVTDWSGTAEPERRPVGAVSELEEPARDALSAAGWGGSVGERSHADPTVSATSATTTREKGRTSVTPPLLMAPEVPGSNCGSRFSPGDSIVREVVDPRRDHHGVWIIVRGLVLEDDVEGTIRVHDLLREQRRHVRRIAVRVAHHQIRGLLELELRLEADGIHLPALFAREPFGPELNRSRDRHPPLEGARRDEEHVRPDRDAAACGPDRLRH